MEDSMARQSDVSAVRQGKVMQGCRGFLMRNWVWLAAGSGVYR